MSKCIVDGCEKATSAPGAHGLCPSCYQGMRYWRGRSVGDIMRRHKQLHKLASRMELLSPNRRR